MAATTNVTKKIGISKKDLDVRVKTVRITTTAIASIIIISDVIVWLNITLFAKDPRKAIFWSFNNVRISLTAFLASLDSLLQSRLIVKREQPSI